MNADAEKYLGYLVERIHTTVLSQTARTDTRIHVRWT